MGARPMTAAPHAANPAASAEVSQSWTLAPEYAAQTQGLVVSPFAHLEEGRALLLTLPEKCGGAWLKALRSAIPITDCTGKATPSSAIASITSCVNSFGTVLTPMMAVGLSALIASTKVDTGARSCANGF